MPKLTLLVLLLSAMLLSGCATQEDIKISNNGYGYKIHSIDIGNGVVCYYYNISISTMSCVFIPPTTNTDD